jgi:hypothetical protein
MATRAPSSTFAPTHGLVGPSVGVVLCLALVVVSAAALAVMGYWALVIPLYVSAAVGALFFPRQFVFVLLVVAVVIEPQEIDFTAPLARAIYFMPPAIKGFFPLTISPLEVALLLTAASLAMRPRVNPVKHGLPILIWAVPVVFAVGWLYGMRGGGESNLAYHEARGLIFASVAFFIAWRIGLTHHRAARVALFTASTGLSSLLLIRYLFYTRESQSLTETAFAHEDSVLLGIGLVLGCLLLLRVRKDPARLLLFSHNVLVLAAVMATGRRSATLVVLVAALVLIWLLLPRRPLVVLAVTVPLMLAGGIYLAAYWNQQYGAAAQPARAIRSQFDPNPRDDSSDQYRVNEKSNVLATIETNRPLGVGFGRPFAQFIPLPDLTEQWPLQAYTPHQNVLWLWLKMGIFGIAVMLALWVLALQRCLIALRSVRWRAEIPVAPLLIAATLLIYLTYARVDLALIGTRSAVPLGVALALAFCLPLARKEEKADRT